MAAGGKPPRIFCDGEAVVSGRSAHDIFARFRRARDLDELDVAYAMLSPDRLRAFSICLARVVADDADSVQLVVSTVRA